MVTRWFVALGSCCLWACEPGAAGQQGDVVRVEERGEADGQRLEILGVLAFLNGPEATVERLDIEVGLDVRAARAIVAHVRGPDGVLGTADDDLLDSLAELSAISYVGESAIAKLVDYVASIGALPELVVEGVAMTAAQAADIVAFVNAATPEQLDDEAGLDRRAVAGLVAARPFADIDAVAAVAYVGETALRLLLDFVVRSQGQLALVGDAAWRAVTAAPAGWTAPGFDDASWPAAAAPAPEACDWTTVTPAYFGRSNFRDWEHADVPTLWSQAQERFAYLRRSFDVPEDAVVIRAMITTSADDDHEVYVNGTQVVSDHDHATGPAFERDIRALLQPGQNVLAIVADDSVGGCRHLGVNGTVWWSRLPGPVEPPPPQPTCSGGAYDGVAFTAAEECQAVAFMNLARYSQMQPLTTEARRVAYDCHPTASGTACYGYRQPTWTSLGPYADTRGVSQAGVESLKRASAAWVDDGLHMDTVANTWVNRTALLGVALSLEKVFVARYKGRVSDGNYDYACVEVRDAPSSANWMQACLVCVGGDSASECQSTCESCIQDIVGGYRRLRGTVRTSSAAGFGGYKINLLDEGSAPDPALP